jgi:hypothetical protein
MTGWTSHRSPAGPPAGEREDEKLRLSDVGKLARRARSRIVGAARAEDRPSFPKMLRAHLGGDVARLEVVEETWPGYDHVNVQVGLDTWLAGSSRTHELVGLTGFEHRDFGMSNLLHQDMVQYFTPTPGNVAWVNRASGPEGRVTPCVQAGLFLVTDGPTRLAALVRAPDPDNPMGVVQLQILADDVEAAQAMAAGVRELAVRHNVYRGQMISFGREMFGERHGAFRFHTRPVLDAESLILPTDAIAAIDRQVVGVAEHRDSLLAARQHLKRGLLLYGLPGVGKTHTVRYLAARLTGVTIIELTGDALGYIGTACSVARTLQPAMVVVEDVDLIAEDRGMHPGQHPLLFQLLNEMDGLDEDADVVFLLTTNRADLLEPALASRPGRIDQAVSLDPPDPGARRRLFALYRGGLDVDESRLDAVIDRTEGVTASFLKELLRRAAVLAATDGKHPVAVSADQLDAALDELMDTRNAMTRVLLGASPSRDALGSHRRPGPSG